MNKNGVNKLVKPEDVQAFTSNGYTKGRLMNTGLLNKGTFWMNNGQVEMKAREDQINDLLAKGYKIGRLQKKVLTTEATPHIGGTQLLQERSL